MKKQLFLGVVLCSLVACGGSESRSFGENIIPDEAFSANHSNVTISFPQNTFATKMSFEFSKDEIDTSELASRYTIQSSAFQLHFSQAQVTSPNKSITLEITLKQGAPSDGLFALIKSEGKRVNQGGDIPASGIWRPTFGTTSDGVFTLNLAASAERQSIVIVTRAADANISKLAKNLAQKNLSVSKAAADAGLFNRPWAIFCDRDNLSEAAKGRCNDNDMKDLSAKYQQAAQALEALNVQQMNVTSTDYVNVQNVFGADFVFSNEADPAGKRHNIAVFTGLNICEIVALGCYDFETQTTYLGEGIFTGNTTESTVIYELTHAVQHSVASNAFNVENALWITEGTAEYVAQGYAPGAVDFGERTWTEPLQKAIDLYTPYQTSKFFDTALPDTGFLYAFLTGLGQGNSSYDLAKNGFDSIGIRFPSKFVDVMKKFYTQNKLGCFDAAPATANEQTSPFPVYPMSSNCSGFVAKDDDKCVEITPTFSDTELTVVDGMELKSGKAYLSSGSTLNYQLISFNTSSDDSAKKDVTIKYKQRDCDNKLIGLWCASDCSNYEDYLRFFEDEHGELKAVAFLSGCEEETSHLSILFGEENYMFFIPEDTLHHNCNCSQSSWQYNLKLSEDNTRLTGTSAHALLGDKDALQVAFQKVSDDPNTLPHWSSTQRLPGSIDDCHGGSGAGGGGPIRIQGK